MNFDIAESPPITFFRRKWNDSEKKVVKASLWLMFVLMPGYLCHQTAVTSRSQSQCLLSPGEWRVVTSYSSGEWCNGVLRATGSGETRQIPGTRPCSPHWDAYTGERDTARQPWLRPGIMRTLAWSHDTVTTDHNTLQDTEVIKLPRSVPWSSVILKILRRKKRNDRIVTKV